MEPFRQNCLFWDAIWKSCGKPINNEVHKIMKRTRNIYHYQLKKTRKAEDRLKRENMLRTCLGMGGDIFKEIKKIRETKQTMANSIDGVENGIAEEFGKIYRRLYNSIDDEEDMIKVTKRVELSINENSHDDVKRITPEILEKATCKLKPGKCDPIMRFTSDFIKNGPKELFKSLSIMYQGFVTHAHIPNELLISTLVPIVKDPLADINQSKNYRSVCLSSLSIKLMDWILIILCKDSLGLNELQFAYQENTSTSQCTWAALEIIDYYRRNGSDVYTITTDMSKAFDMAMHSKMFEEC